MPIALRLPLVIGAMCVPQLVRAEDGDRNAPPPIEYRRIFVPAEKLAAWPRDGEKFLPIDAGDFNAWVAAANRTAGAAPTATIIGATYSARLEGGQLLDGRGEWKIELRRQPAALLPLGDVSLTIREPRWRGDGASPARLGTWGKRGAAARFGLEVPQSGTLDFAWRAPARVTPGGIEIPWSAPPATATQLILELPDGMQPSMDGSIVLESQPGLPLRNQANQAQPAMRRWTLAVGPASSTILRINDARRTSSGDKPTAAVREEFRYHFTERGLDLTATLRFHEPLESRRQLAIQLPDGVKLISAVADGHELSWHFDGSNEPAVTRAMIQIPDGLRPAAVVIQAWRELLLDDPQSLPKLRPEDTVWDSGSMEITIDSTLELRGLVSSECVETSAAISAKNRAEPERFAFAAYSTAANVALTIGRAQPWVTARLGATLTTGDPDISGRIVTELDVERGSVHVLSGVLQPGWSVESVETIPTNALREWFVDRRDGGRQLDVHFARAVRPGQPLTIVVLGSLQRSRVREPLAAGTLRMVQWSGVRVEEHLLSMQAAPPLVIEGVGMPPAIAAEELDDQQYALFGDGIAGPIFELSRASPDASLRLAAERAQFAADIELDAVFTGQELRQHFQLAVHAQKGFPDRLLVYITEPLVGAIRWTDKSSGAPLAAERLPASHPQRARLPSGGELWQLRLPPTRRDSIVIDGALSMPWSSRGALPLVSLPDAMEQKGRVRVRGEPGVAINLEPSRMTAAALPVDETDSANQGPAAARAAYRYDPKSCHRAAGCPRLWLAGGPADVAAKLVVVRLLELESVYSAAGHAAHRATYHLENRGAANFRVKLADDARLESADIDGQPLALPAVANHEPILVPLPRAARFVKATLVVSREARPLAGGNALQPPLVHDELTLLTGHWTIRLPEEFSIVGELAESTESINFPGWNMYTIPFVAQGPWPVTVTRPAVTMAWSVSLFLLCTVVGVQLRRRRLELFICLTATAASLCLLLPTAVAPLAIGSLLGLLFSLLGMWLPRVALDETTTKTWPRVAPAVATLIAWLALVINSAAGQETPDTAERAPATTIHRVLIPLDPAGQVVGSKFYVGERLLRALLGGAAEQGRAGGDWLLRGATYGLELHEQPDRAAIVAGNATITLDVEVMARDTAFELPLVRAEAEWGQASLDGVPCAILWNADGRGCRLVIGEPGRYLLKIAFIPRIRESVAGNQIGLTVPQLLGARMTLDFPTGLVGLNVSGTSGPLNRPAPGKLSGELDATGRLVIRWPRQDASTAEVQDLRVEELHWLHVSDEVIILDAKYVMEGSHRPEALTLITDHRWQLVANDDSSAKAEIDTDSADRQSIRVATSVIASNRSQALLRFRLTGASLPGNVRLPPIETASLPVTRRWLGVSSDGALECEITGGGNAAAKPFDEFLTLWEGKAKPAIDPLGQSAAAAAESSPAAAWRVAVRPRRVDSSVEEALQIAAGQDQLRVLYRAEVRPGTLHQFQLAINVPANLTIDRLDLLQDGKSLPIRWLRQKDGLVQVFFGEKMNGPYRIVLTGQVPAGASGKVPLPRVAISGRDAPPPRIWLYRPEDRLVELQGTSELAKADAPPIEPPPATWNVRPVGSYQLSREDADRAVLTITANPAITPNPVETAGETPTTVPVEAPPAERPSASVRLADSVVLEGPAGDRVTSTRFVVVPSGLVECQLQLPADEQLAAVNLDDRPATIRPLELRRIAVQLGPSGLPQNLEVVTRFVGSDSPAGRRELPRPTLLVDGTPVPVELGFWSIGRLPGAARQRVLGASPVKAIEQSALRLERLISVVEAATPVALAAPAAESDSWFRAWSTNLTTLRHDAANLPASSNGAGEASQVAAVTDDQLARVGQRI
ncbi:MAG: hypothetical protein WD669_06965, partial [Pirellulales bacterium]